jgi:lipoyl synthase
MLSEEPFDNRPIIAKKKINKLPENPENRSEEKAVSLGRFPSWLHRKLPEGKTLFQTNAILRESKLNTVCEEAKCPNRFECYSKRTATFLALGKECTRSCSFCGIDFSKAPKLPEKDEPDRIVASVKKLGLKHVVITMVARDDLPDYGASAFAAIVKKVHEECEDATVEVLTSDFSGDYDALDLVLNERPAIFNHNIETVRSLTPRIRHKATYERTLAVLRHAKERALCQFIKSGIMVGFGETKDQVEETIRDLHTAGCDIITIGHYLQASRLNVPVKAFVTPEQFKAYEEYGYSIGVKYMYCGPFVRSSYNAHLIKDLSLKVAHG